MTKQVRLICALATCWCVCALHVGTPFVLAAAPPGVQSLAVDPLPGVAATDPQLKARLEDAWQRRPPSPPRTQLLRPDGRPKYANRLLLEASPYLQQHAFNPVNWYPWGDEAFAAAKREDKPIFLSIGYSTCHWCHVMEEESFDNERVATLLNERFIAIKVDREERPDVDNVYVAAVQQMTGGAGWPLTVFLTPERQPFYGGTYFPPDDRYGRPGFVKLLTTIADAWKTRREQVLAASTDLTKSLRATTAPTDAPALSADAMARAQTSLAKSFDATRGGFGRAPKFPQAHTLQFLLRDWSRRQNAESLRMATLTLEQMARGGIHDQLGGGFHRYSTDADWFVPHYEKMLYDQAINARAYLEAFQATANPVFAAAARDIFAYVLRDLTAPTGGFYAAEDADSDGAEGRFYVWSRAEVTGILGNEAGPVVADFYGLTQTKSGTDGGSSDPQRPLRVALTPAQFAQQRSLDVRAFETRLAQSRATLFAARSKRARPHRDDKIITAWNGLMISSLAYGATVLDDPTYVAAATRATEAVLNNTQRGGRLARSARNGATSTPGFLDDYAFFIAGVLDLYQATLDTRWLREADRLTRDMLRLFATPDGRDLRFSGSDHEALIAAGDERSDGALPAAQSVAAMDLLRLGRLTMNDGFTQRGRALLEATAGDAARAPAAFTSMLTAFDFALGPVKEVVIAGPRDAAATQALLRTVRQHYLPRAVVALHAPDDGAIEQLVPFLAKLTMTNGQPTAYVCENYVCKLPTRDPKRLAELLKEEPPPPQDLTPHAPTTR